MRQTENTEPTSGLAICASALRANNFGVYVVETPGEAHDLIVQRIVPSVAPKTASWGDSETLLSSRVIEALKGHPELDCIDTLDRTVPAAELYERRRRALLVDLFLTGSNAVTSDGKLVNLDMTGNRVGAICFGPKCVTILVGRNKIVPDVAAAMERIRRVAAPQNAKRREKSTPCVETGICCDCSCPDRICNEWTIIEKSYPRERITVILINQDLGL